MAPQKEAHCPNMHNYSRRPSPMLRQVTPTVEIPHDTATRSRMQRVAHRQFACGCHTVTSAAPQLKRDRMEQAEKAHLTACVAGPHTQNLLAAHLAASPLAISRSVSAFALAHT
jgi:hypothetical protein